MLGLLFKFWVMGHQARRIKKRGDPPRTGQVARRAEHKQSSKPRTYVYHP